MGRRCVRDMGIVEVGARKGWRGTHQLGGAGSVALPGATVLASGEGAAGVGADALSVMLLAQLIRLLVWLTAYSSSAARAEGGGRTGTTHTAWHACVDGCKEDHTALACACAAVQAAGVGLWLRSSCRTAAAAGSVSRSCTARPTCNHAMGRQAWPETPWLRQRDSGALFFDPMAAHPSPRGGGQWLGEQPLLLEPRPAGCQLTRRHTHASRGAAQRLLEDGIRPAATPFCS